MLRRRDPAFPLLALILGLGLSLLPLTGSAQEPEEGDNAELRRMYEEDQADRSQPHDQMNWEEISERDRQHRERVTEMLEAGLVKTANDHWHAAMIFQHGGTPEDAKKAHELAKKATELNPEHRNARWLSAAAWDRYKMYLGEPQWYGTQFRRGEDGIWYLYDVDENAVTDEERKAMGVPTLEESRQQAAEMNEPRE